MNLINLRSSSSLWPLLAVVFSSLLLNGCVFFMPERYLPVDRTHSSKTAEAEFYISSVKPIIESRCVSCHACYDAPCQLKLSSAQGVDRGVHGDAVYDGTRLLAADPSRLFVDAQSTAEWRELGFKPVLNETVQNTEANKSASMLYQTLALKNAHPLPQTERLSKDSFEFGVQRKHSCPSPKQYERYAEKNPLAGMPYGLPGISDKEFAILEQWIEQGAVMTELRVIDPDILKQISQWEGFLNQSGNKAQLSSRYIFEHLHLANLYFSKGKLREIDEQAPDDKVYFKLVRSHTPPGQDISVIATRRASDDPGVEKFYYRLQVMQSALVGKTHLPYALNQERLDWIKELFIKPNYVVKNLPGYDDIFLNPFVTFKDIPVRSRYRFMLEESEFIIGGFIKGPVCRGQVAVDVINDHFWVFFVNPDADAIPAIDNFVEAQSSNLRLPGLDGSTTGILTPWLQYSHANREYLIAKREALQDVFEGSMRLDEKLIWDGDGNNGNAALTIFRHFDSASVVQGLVGVSPKTAWVIDYPLLERIHYLLAVDFDVFGNVGHQLNTRLYMDFLRIEGEYNFLTLMPPKERLELRDYWYRDADEKVKEYLYSCESYLDEIPAINYSTANPKEELFDILKRQLSPALEHRFDVNHEPSPIEQVLARLHHVEGKPATVLPEVSNLLVSTKDGSQKIFSIIANKAHSNITSLFHEDKYRLPEEDTLTVANGVVGDNPNAFIRVEQAQLQGLVDAISSVRTEDDYRRLMKVYGVRRTNPDFWQHSDSVHAVYKSQQPDLASRLDYNRLENR